MRGVVGGVLSAALVFAAGAASAQPDSGENASRAVGESAEGVAALAEVGLKATVGVASAPVAVAAVGSGAAASSAGLSAEGLSSATAGMSAAAEASAAFSAEPLSVTDEVIVAPQPAPAVPFDKPAPGR